MRWVLEDTRKLRALADLCDATEPKRRAAHLGEWARKKADEIEEHLVRAGG